jgi:endogenous inhibitor of DNA gyrase (YacG/DUF329 family)
LIDFGSWADETYALPEESGSISEEDLREIERALEEKAKQR